MLGLCGIMLFANATLRGAAMQRIADWLQKLGLGQYAQRFVENDIEIDVLSELTDQDFDRLGVSLGHRRRMIRAIRELGTELAAAVAGAGIQRRSTQNPPLSKAPSAAK